MLDAYLGALLALVTVTILVVLLGWMFAPKGRTIARPASPPANIQRRGHKTNAERVIELENHWNSCLEQIFEMGEVVQDRHGHVGRIDSIFPDVYSAIDKLIIPPNWYELQNPQPATKPTGIWYGVVLANGAILVGQEDLITPEIA